MVRGTEQAFETYLLCDLYHCKPSELEDEDLQVLQQHLIIRDEVKKEEERQMKEASRMK